MANMINIGVSQVANRAFVPLAIEAGILSVIKSLIPLAADKLSLLASIKEALEASNAPLAAALNTQTLDAILDYMSDLESSPVLSVEKLPRLKNEAGPSSVSAARDAGAPTQVNVTYSAPPAGYTAEIYLDGVFQKHSIAAASGGFVNDFIANVPVDGVSHSIRVLYRTEDGSITRFGTLASF